MLDTSAPRRRTPRLDVHLTRQALAIVAPINRQIGPWQAQTARLIAYGTRLRQSGGSEPGLTAELEALASAVETQRRKLHEHTGTLPAELARHSSIEDTERALQTVMAGVAQAARLLRSDRRIE